MRVLQVDYICVTVVKLSISTLELTCIAILLGRSITYDVVHWRLMLNQNPLQFMSRPFKGATRALSEGLVAGVNMQ